jgi:hypothetical protein
MTKFHGDTHQDKTYIATLHCPGAPTLTGVPSLVTIDSNQICKVVIENCARTSPLRRTTLWASLKWRRTNSILSRTSPPPESVPSSRAISPTLPELTREDIARRCHLQVPDEFITQYLDLLFKYKEAIRINKYDLGLAKKYKHKIHLKNDNPVNRKQFKIPEAHHNFIEQILEEWLKLGVVLRSDSLFNSPIFCVPKKQGQGLRIVQDFRELN